MAVTDLGAAQETVDRVRKVSWWHFARLKLRLMRNGFRGQTGRILLYIFGGLFGLYLGGMGFLLFASMGGASEQTRLMVSSLGGAVLVLGSVLLPLVWFGVDDTLDPARFALLPLPRWRLMFGLLTAALLGIPAVALLMATSGLVVSAGVSGGVAAVAAQALGVLGGLLLCVAAGRAVTSGFATMLRSRRVRDLAGILLATLAALLAPLQIVILSAARRADWDQVAAVAGVVGWTPLGAPYTVGIEVAAGSPGGAVVKLLITAATVAVLLWWWSRSLESAMTGAASSSGPAPSRPAAGTGAVAQLLPRLMPGLRATDFGALVAREARYWWRDAKRRANLISIAVIGVVVPMLVGASFTFSIDGEEAGFGPSFAASPTLLSFTLLFVGAFAPALLANQFGFDGTAYAGNIIAGVSGREELRARSVALSMFVVPLLVLIGAVMAVIVGDPEVALLGWGALFAGYGTGLAVNHYLSIFGAYSLPETSNPFAINTGAGAARSLLSLLSVVVAFGAAMPVVLAATLLGEVWVWLALPVGLLYGVGAALLGCYLAGDILDRRAPEVLAAVTPRR